MTHQSEHQKFRLLNKHKYFLSDIRAKRRFLTNGYRVNGTKMVPINSDILELLESAIYAYKDLSDAKPESLYAPIKMAAEERLFDWFDEAVRIARDDVSENKS